MPGDIDLAVPAILGLSYEVTGPQVVWPSINPEGARVLRHDMPTSQTYTRNVSITLVASDFQVDLAGALLEKVQLRCMHRGSTLSNPRLVAPTDGVISLDLSD